MQREQQREKLIEIIASSVGGCARNWAEVIADGLLDNGIIAPPCKVGDTVYVLFANQIIECVIARIAIEPLNMVGMSFYSYGGYIFDMRHLNKSVFLTREEAKAALKKELKKGKK